VSTHFDGKTENFEGGYRSGMTWVAKDGSRVTAEEVKSVPAPEKHAPPWQLLKVTAHEGKGRLNLVEWIQRIDTHDAGAKYVFYGSK